MYEKIMNESKTFDPFAIQLKEVYSEKMKCFCGKKFVKKRFFVDHLEKIHNYNYDDIDYLLIHQKIMEN